MSLSYLLFLLHWEQTFSSDIRRNALQIHPSPSIKQTVLQFSRGEYFTHTTMGLVLPSIYILENSQSPFLLSLIWCQNLGIQHPPRINSFRSSTTKEEMGRSRKIFYKPTCIIITSSSGICTGFLMQCKLLRLLQGIHESEQLCLILYLQTTS